MFGVLLSYITSGNVVAKIDFGGSTMSKNAQLGENILQAKESSQTFKLIGNFINNNSIYTHLKRHIQEA